MGGGYAWVTLATNDSYSLGALVLAHSLKQVGTKQSLVVLVTPGVTNPMRSKLSSVFDIVHEVNILDSKDESNLRLLKRPELGVTFTKLHCWRLTQFEKCVFLDADTLVLQNCDELFDREELSAAPDIGWPDCFNSGVFVYRPSNETYEKLVQFALEKGSFDGGDQGLLNLYFSDWAYKDISKHLPFIYNMSSTATYSYLPAFKQFGGDAKIIHFIAGTKPWLQYFNTETKQVQVSNDLRHLTTVLQHWWNIFCNCVHSDLTPDMARSTTVYSPITINNPVSIPDYYNKHNDDSHIEYYDPWDDYDQKISNPTFIQHNQQEPFEIQPIESHNTNVSSFQAVHNAINPFSHDHQYQSENSRVHNYTYIPQNHHPVENPPEHHHHHPVDNLAEHHHHHHPTENHPEHYHHQHHSENHHHEIYNHIPETFHSHEHQVHETAVDNNSNYQHDSNIHRSLPPRHSPHPQPTQIFTYNNSSQNSNSSTTNSNPEINRTAPPVVVETFPNHKEPTFVALPKECETTNINEIKLQKFEEKDDSGIAGAFAQLTLGVARTAEQIALDDHLRRQGWEVGNIDYLGRDSFDNIWSKICETLASGPVLPQSKEPSPPKTEVIQSSETVVPAKETPTQVKPTEVQTPQQTQTDKTETKTPPSPKTDAPTETPVQQSIPLPEPPKESGEIKQTATQPDTSVTPDTSIETAATASLSPSSDTPVSQDPKIAEKIEKAEPKQLETESVPPKLEESKVPTAEVSSKTETELPPKTETPVAKVEVPVEAETPKTETVSSVQSPEPKTETTTVTSTEPVTAKLETTPATPIETPEVTQTKAPIDVQAAKPEATTPVQLEAPAKDIPAESPKIEPSSTPQSPPATAPVELASTKPVEEKQTPVAPKTEELASTKPTEQKEPPAATTEGPACPKPEDLACAKTVEEKQLPAPSPTAPKPEELAKPAEQKQSPIPLPDVESSPKPTEQKQSPTPAPAPAPIEPTSCPKPEELTCPKPTEQKESPVPAPTQPVPGPKPEELTCPKPTEQKQSAPPTPPATESPACPKPEKVEEITACPKPKVEPATEQSTKSDTTKVEPKPKEEKKAAEKPSEPQPKVKEATEPAPSKGGDGSTGSTPTPPPRKGSSGTKKTKSKK